MPNNQPKAVGKRRRNRKRTNKQPPLNPLRPDISSGRTAAPIAKTRVTRNAAPKFKQTAEGCVISHREYITDISRAAATFTIDTFNVNAGLVSTFPWLSQVASRFESYTFERLNFIYEPMVSTSTAGSLMMAVDFDASDTAPVNKVTLMSYAGATRSSMWQPTRLVCSAIDRRKMVPERYVRSGALAASNDVKTYDLGNLFVASIGTSTTTTFGELYAEYTVRLRTPQIQTNPGLSLSGRRATQQGQFTFNQAGKVQAHIANITGEGNQPILQVIDQAIRIDPRIKRCLLTLVSTPSTNWRATISTCLSNLRSSTALPPPFNNVPFWGDPNTAVPIVQGYGASSPQYAPKVAGTSGGVNQLIETYIFGELDEEVQRNDARFGQGLTSLPVVLRDDLITGTGIVTTNYTLTPLDSEVWPKIDAAFKNIINNWGAGTNKENDVIDWPTFDSATPGRSLQQGVQVFHFNSKEPLPDLTPTRK